MGNELTIYEYFDVFMFWYVLIITWVLLVSSIILFISAVRYNSWNKMLLSVILMTPNVLFVIFDEVEKVMYLYIVWFGLQIYMLIRIFRQKQRA